MFFFFQIKIVREFAQRKKEIAKLTQDVQTRGNHLENYTSEIEELRNSWHQPLQELISKINKNFSDFFKQMNCAGEVDLSVPENPVCI